MSLISIFIWISLLLDSGGTLGLRNVAFILMIFSIVGTFFQNRFRLNTISFQAIVLNIFVILFVGLSIFVNDVEFITAFTYSGFLIFLLVSLLWACTLDRSTLMSSYISSSIVYIAIFFSVHTLLLLSVVDGEETLKFLNTYFSGRFHEKIFYGYNYYVIYPQAVLFVSGLSVLLFMQGRYLLYFLSLLFLVASTSRFGVMVALIFPFLLMYFNSRTLSYFLLRSYWLFLFLVLLCYCVVYFFYNESFSPNYYAGLSSFEARVGHLLSSFHSFNNVHELIIGQGAGSEFFSLRSLSYVNNSELSQLEFFRKYGLVGFVLYHLIVFLSLSQCYSKSRYGYFLLVYSTYFSTISNPVVTSLIFSLLVAGGFSVRRKV